MEAEDLVVAGRCGTAKAVVTDGGRRRRPVPRRQWWIVSADDGEVAPSRRIDDGGTELHPVDEDEVETRRRQQCWGPDVEHPEDVADVVQQASWSSGADPNTATMIGPARPWDLRAAWKAGSEMRPRQPLHTHRHRRRAFAGSLSSTSEMMSSGSERMPPPPPSPSCLHSFDCICIAAAPSPVTHAQQAAAATRSRASSDPLLL